MDKMYEVRNKIAIGLIFQYGQMINESHHQTWLIDQILRTLAGNDYDKVISEYEKECYDADAEYFDTEGELPVEHYKWDIGIAP